MVAPFWADHDIRPSGQISYEIHDANSQYTSIVNRFIRQQTGIEFEGSWMLLGRWDDVPEYGANIDSVSFFLAINFKFYHIYPDQHVSSSGDHRRC